MKKWLALALFLSSWPVFATDLRFKQEFGRSTQALVLEEEEDDDRFSFWKASLGVTQGDEKAKFHLDAFRHEKDYKTRLTDFESNRVEAEAWRRLQWRGEEFRGGAFASWRNRDFDRFSLQSFREFRAGAYAQDWMNWSARASASFYDYEGGRNESRVKGQISRKLKWHELELRPKAAAEHHDGVGRRKFKAEGGFLASLEPDMAHWQRFSLEAEAGQGDTKVLEDREDDLDYTFWETKLNSRHEIRDGHSLRWMAGMKRKDDIGGNFTHRGTLAELAWKWPVLSGGRKEEKLTLEPFTGFKRIKFTESPLLTYERTALGANASLLSWGEWRINGMGKVDFYNFTTQNKRRQRTTARLFFERSLEDGAEIRLGGTLRHTLLSFDASLAIRL